MEIAAINAFANVLKTIITAAKSKGVIYLISAFCYCIIIIAVVLITFLFYAALYALIKTKRQIIG